MSATEVAPLLFHKTHGRKVKMSADMRQATRLKDYHKAVCFSNRPVGANEQVHIEISDTTPFWDGVMRIGFTHFNPGKMKKGQIPTDMSQGVTTRPGYWAVELTQTFAKKGNVLSFYVTPAGFVTYAVCGVEEAMNFSDFNPTRPLWAVIDIYGNTTSVKIVAVTKSPATAAAYGPLSSLSQSVDDECIVCMDRAADCVLLPCAHTYLCYMCAVTIRASDNASCPFCRHAIDGINNRRDGYDNYSAYRHDGS